MQAALIQLNVSDTPARNLAGTVEMVRDAAAKLSIDVEIEKVSDYAQIAMAGVISTPGITIDGKLVHSGGLPDAAALETWLAA